MNLPIERVQPRESFLEFFDSEVQIVIVGPVRLPKPVSEPVVKGGTNGGFISPTSDSNEGLEFHEVVSELLIILLIESSELVLGFSDLVEAAKELLELFLESS